MPVKFEIYRDGNRVTTLAPVAAMAMGPESVPIPGEVSVKDGLVVIGRSDEHPVGLSLLWDVGPLGAYHMETTRLPAREKPYILNVELARFRLMKIIQKQEDWNLFDFPRAEKFMQRFKEAQTLFSDALGVLDDPAAASRLADQSLAISLDLSEQLAHFHAELLINRRRAGSSFVRHIVGARVDSTVQNAKYKEMLSGNFDYAVVPMSWKQLQPEEGAFNTEALDEWVETLSRKKIPIIAGPLIDLNEGQVPDWLFIWEHDFDTLRDMAYEFVQKVVHRYRRAVAVWNVCSGMHTNRAFTLSFEQIIEMTRLLVAHVKNMLPQARTLVTITQPFGEYHASARPSVAPMLYAEMVSQAGINFEAFGLEMELGVPAAGGYLRDLFQVSCMLDRFSTLGRPLFVTAVGVPGRMTPDATDASEGRLDPAAAGRWHRPWDPQLQAEWLEQIYRIALSKPFVESVAWSNLADIGHTIPAGGLLDDMLRPKPTFERLQKMRDQFHQWTGRKPPTPPVRREPRVGAPYSRGLARGNRSLPMNVKSPTILRRALNFQIWTRRQRFTLASLTLLTAITFLLLATRRPLHISDPPLPTAPRAHELASRIDPNQADWPTLAALPQIGEKRAKQILAYRDQFTRTQPTRRPFTTLQDLENVPGIGPATADALAPYLLFPNETSER